MNKKEEQEANEKLNNAFERIKESFLDLEEDELEELLEELDKESEEEKEKRRKDMLKKDIVTYVLSNEVNWTIEANK